MTVDALIAYHFGWRNNGYYPESYITGPDFQAVPFPIEKTPYWTDWKGRLPFYIPKGFPVSVSSIEKKLGRKFGLVLEIDGSGQYHLRGTKRERTVSALWSHDIYRKDRQKFYHQIKKDFDLVFAAHKNFVSVYGDKAVWLPYGCDPKVTRDFGLPKIYDVTFIGNTRRSLYSERMNLIDALSRHFKVNVVNGVYAESAARIYSQSKIVFNKTVAGEINHRVFEAPACRTLLMTDRLKPETGIEELFQDRKHMIFYDNEADLIEKTAYYLSHENERQEITDAGYREMHANHTFSHRFRMILDTVRNLGKMQGLRN